jgi:hypothetical protein
MQNSISSKRSSSKLGAPPQLDLLLEQTTPVDLHQERRRRHKSPSLPESAAGDVGSCQMIVVRRSPSPAFRSEAGAAARFGEE